ncbi:MAG: enoyl-CoA hydratase/isomerase family protein [Candidatus Dormiibacterota bacterium]
MTPELVLTEIEDGVLTITLNRPEKRNALSLELFEAIGEAFNRAAQPEVKAVLLKGNGPVFCAGIDLNALGQIGGDIDSFKAGVAHLQDIYMRLERIGKPSVAAIQGAALGGGLQLAMACDLRVATEDARLGLFEIHYGIVPDLTGIHRMVHLCGLSRAKDLIMTGREIQPKKAMRIGLVDRVALPEELLEVASELVREIATKAPLAVRAAKRRADQAAAGQSVEDNLSDVRDAQLECIKSPDFMEAVAARLEKRTPVFSGG